LEFNKEQGNGMDKLLLPLDKEAAGVLAHHNSLI